MGGSVAAYAIQQHIVNTLLRPAHGQSFIYTSPIGGIDFLFRVCLYTGMALSIPVVVYNLLRYLEPLARKDSFRFVTYTTVCSGVFAIAGILFGYYVGLPAALHFLLHQFVTPQIHAMLTVQSYLSFVALYMFGSALLFQVPLIVLFINRIKPLKPNQLFRYERWVILGAFVMSGLMNPTPNLLDQLLVAGPLILMYQVSIGIIAVLDRRHTRTEALNHGDAAAQAERLERLRSAQTAWQEATVLGDGPVRAARPASLPAQPDKILDIRPAPIGRQPMPGLKPPAPARSRRYVDGFIISRRRSAVPNQTRFDSFQA